jgi:RNA polymerase sigma-70 factor (ECF subfamily)
MRPRSSPATEGRQLVDPSADRSVTFQSLLEPLLPRAYAAAVHFTGSAAEAEDLVQEAALLALQGFSTFRAGTNFKVWFLRILTDTFSKRCGASQRRPTTLSADGATDLHHYRKTSAAGSHDRSADLARTFTAKLEAEQVAAAIGSLPDAYRVVATLYFVDDLSYQEIAAIVDGSVETVRSRLHRGRKLLQAALWRVAGDQGLV